MRCHGRVTAGRRQRARDDIIDAAAHLRRSDTGITCLTMHWSVMMVSDALATLKERQSSQPEVAETSSLFAMSRDVDKLSLRRI